MINDYTAKQKLMVRELESSFAHGNSKSTVVEMKKDYLNDDQICLTSVVLLPQLISRKIIKSIVQPLREIESGHYFFSEESMHLTIKNIRTINKPPLFTQSDVNKVNGLFSETIKRFNAFDFNIEDVVLFPTSISVMAYSDHTLQELVQALDNGLKEIGVPDNKRYLSDSIFWGNITICRFIKNPSEQFIDEVKKMRQMKIGSFSVKSINLITSNVVLNPKTLKIIAKYQLNKENSAFK